MDKILADILPLASLYCACCCLCIIFWIWIEYLFGDPCEHDDIRSRLIKIVVLVAAFSGLLYYGNAVQTF